MSAYKEVSGTPGVSPGQQLAKPETATTVQVQGGETLWGIATEWSRGSGLDVNKVMLAIQRENPQAFDLLGPDRKRADDPLGSREGKVHAEPGIQLLEYIHEFPQLPVGVCQAVVNQLDGSLPAW